MTNLNVKFKNLNFKNPVIMASGTFGFGKEYGENIKIIAEVDENSKQEICKNSEKSRFKVIESRIVSKKLIRKIR